MPWIIIAGSIQSGFLAFFLFCTTRGNKIANRVLASYFLMVGCFLAVPELIRSYVYELPHLIAISFPLLYLIGPLLYLYTRLLLRQHEPFKKIALLHGLPSLIALVFLVPFYIKSGSSKLEFFKSLQANGMPIDFSLLWFVACVHIITYQAVAYRLVMKYNRLTKHYFSKLEQVRVVWLEKFALSSTLLWLLYFIGYILLLLGVENDSLGYIDRAFASILTLFLYYISFVGLSKPEIFPGPYLPMLQKVEARKNTIHDKKIYAEQLEDLMAGKKPYLDSELSLSSLALMINLAPRTLSQVINEEFHKSFFDYVNYYRVEESKRRLADPAFSHLTIVAIGLDSGFNSKSTFNDTFKKFEGLTPSKYKSRVYKVNSSQ